jgi:hypothetical protein
MILYSKLQRAEAVIMLAELGIPRSSQVCVDDVSQVQAISGTYFLLIEDVNALRIPAEIWAEIKARCTILQVKRRR